MVLDRLSALMSTYQIYHLVHPKTGVLRMLPRFEALTPMARWSVAKLCEERSFEDGDTLCHQVPREDVEDSFFLLLEGELEERVHLKGKTEPTLVNSYKFQGITKSGPHIVGRG